MWKIEEMMGWLMLTISWGYEGDTCSLDISCNKTAKACQDQ
jgi:hypothetical protein